MIAVVEEMWYKELEDPDTFYTWLTVYEPTDKNVSDLLTNPVPGGDRVVTGGTTSTWN